MRAPVLDELHAPATVRAGASLALRRAGAAAALTRSALDLAFLRRLRF